MKRGTAFFDRNIRVDQTGLSGLIFCSSYLLINFKLGFIQDRDETNGSELGRPCKAEIRWYDGTDGGLVDIWPDVILWGTDQEVECWHVLRNLPGNDELSDTDISNKLLNEDWPPKPRMKYVATMGI